LQTGKGFANRASNAANKKAATAVAEEGSAALAAVFAKGAKAVEDLKKVSRRGRGRGVGGGQGFMPTNIIHTAAQAFLRNLLFLELAIDLS
jgi:hypothetical protein